MKTCLVRAAMAAVGMFLCAVVTFLTPPLWEGVSGRDYRPQAVKMAFLVLLLAAVLRRKSRWRVADFLLGLLLAEAVTLGIISHFSGFTGREIFDPYNFNLKWLLSISTFIAPPWILGLGLGSLWLWLSEKHAKRAA